MNKFLLATASAVLTAAFVAPAAAITFPSLTTIYIHLRRAR